MNKTIAALAVLAGLLGPAAAGARGQEVVEEIVALVNDDIITLSEYKEMFDLRLADLRAQQMSAADYDKAYAELKKGLLDFMISDLLLLQKAKELGLNVQEQIKGMVQKVVQDNHFSSEADLRRAVEQSGISYERWLKEYEEGMMRSGALYTEVERSIVLDDAEIVQYYKKNPAEFTTPTEYRINAIYLGAEAHPGDAAEAAKAAVDARLAGGASFADTAAELSDPPMKEARGDLGTFKAGELDRTLEAAVEKLQPGETSAWVGSKNGWYLLHLAGKTPSALRPFDEARAQVAEKLHNEKMSVKSQEYLKTLRERSYVKILRPDPLEK
ncbi:MAG TPA: peptidyl-prolyl cis-trans isomerase [Candidatus Aminicenantes bacterium]|nr:peptidyl-prolyl cis-trans isomerase [Candidatus Aminicenantes bacterium]